MENKIWIMVGLLGTLCACTPPEDTPDKPADGPDLFSEDLTPAGPAPTASKAPPKKLSIPDRGSIDLNPGPKEPDYAALRATSMAKHESEFKGPDAGMQVVLVLKDGTKKQGIFEKIEGEKVFIEIPNVGTLGYGRGTLHPMSQTKYFQQTYAQYKTLLDLKDAKAAYEQAVQDAEIAKAQAAHKSPGRKVAVTPTVPKNDLSKGGEVWQVVQYLRKESRAPDQLRYLKWGKVQPKPGGDGGWQVSLQYAYSTPEQSNYVTHKWFLIDKNGTVYRTALYKE
ncbi:MAG: hypothetical protein ACI9TH_002479 [Kiritimatiellia bacterium]|jgi:hypothetical protein